MELWLAYSLAAILLYGMGQGIAKDPLSRVGPARTLLLLGLFNIAFYAAYFLLFREDLPWTSFGIALSVAGGVLGALGFIYFYEALDRGNSAVVGSVTASYPAIAVAVGLLVLGESITNLQALGVLMVVLAVIFLSREDVAGGGHPGSGRYMLLSLAAWGASTVFEKMAITEIGAASYSLVYVLAAMPIYLLHGRQSPTEEPITWGDVVVSLPPLLLFLFGGLFIVLAMKFGQLSIVAPLTATYPVVTIVFRRLWARDPLAASSAVATAAAVAGTLLTVVH